MEKGLYSIFYLGGLILFFKKNHLLIFLMVLETLSVSMLLYLMFFFFESMYDFSVLIYFLIILVCEAVMGLVLLTMFVRCHGEDYFKVYFTSC